MTRPPRSQCWRSACCREEPGGLAPCGDGRHGMPWRQNPQRQARGHRRSNRTARDNGLAPTGDQLCCRAHRVVLGMRVTHEHRDGLVRGQRHADLDRNAGVGDVGGGSMADAVCPDRGYAGTIKNAPPGLAVRIPGQWLLAIEDRRTDIGGVLVQSDLSVCRPRPTIFLSRSHCSQDFIRAIIQTNDSFTLLLGRFQK